MSKPQMSYGIFDRLESAIEYQSKSQRELEILRLDMCKLFSKKECCWTDQDVKDAKELKRLRPRAEYAYCQGGEFPYVRAYGGKYPGIRLVNEEGRMENGLFVEILLSLEPGEVAKLSDIIGGAE